MVYDSAIRVLENELKDLEGALRGMPIGDPRRKVYGEKHDDVELARDHLRKEQKMLNFEKR
jgi:hypothetical protein